MNPRGATPKPILAADDVLLDLQCSLDSQCANTTMTLAFMAEAETDGVIDFEEWRYVKRHLRLEDQLNLEAWSLSKWLRWWFAKVNRLVARLRLEAQVAKGPLGKAAPQQNQSTAF